MPQTNTPTGGTPFPFDSVRTGIIMSYRIDDFIADMVLPATPPLPASKFSYTKWDRGDAFKIPNVRLGRKGKVNEVEYEGQQVVDETEHYGLGAAVPQTDVDAAMVNRRLAGVEVDPIADAARGVKHSLMLAREKRVADLVFSNDSYAATHRMALANGSRFDDAGFNPWPILVEAKSKILATPNTLVFGEDAWVKFSTNPYVLKAVHGNDGDAGVASEMAVAKILGIKRILVGKSRVDNAAEGQAENLGRLWGKSVAMLHLDPTALSAGTRIGDQMIPSGTEKRPTFGFTAAYEMYAVYTGFDPRRGLKGTHLVDVKESCKEVICGDDGFGYLFTTVVD